MSQEFDSNVLDLVKQKGFYSYEYMNDFKRFKGELSSKESLECIWDENSERLSRFVLKRWCFIISWCFSKN